MVKIKRISWKALSNSTPARVVNRSAYRIFITTHSNVWLIEFNHFVVGF